jgi:pimeloyl-ACP methyl ester carboxylesterase
MYPIKRASRSEFIPIRNLTYHVRLWGEARPGVPPLVMVHGWMDVAASYQFVVDAFSEAFATGRLIIAPDWRGYGQTALPGTDNYWFPDYLADLDCLLDQVAGDQPVDLVGHSMGGNVAMMYGGVRPERIRRLVNLEGFGLPATRPSQAPERYAKWIDQIKALQRGEVDLKTYDSAEGVARRLMKTNPRLQADKAHWLAQHWAAPDAQNRWVILGEPAHKIISAHLYHLDEALATYQRISAPVLSVTASDDSLGQWWKGQYNLAQYQERLLSVPRIQQAVVQDAGHMMHHDQPDELARLIDAFLSQPD